VTEIYHLMNLALEAKVPSDLCQSLLCGLCFNMKFKIKSLFPKTLSSLGLYAVGSEGFYFFI